LGQGDCGGEVSTAVSDVHRLFDKGYITVDPDYRIVVGDLLREHFKNGRTYYPLKDRRLVVLPATVADRPDPDLLRWHNQHVFLG